MDDLSLVSELLLLLEQGGFVMPFLVVGLLGLWYGLGWRFLTLRRGDRRSVVALVALAEDDKLAPVGLLPHAVVAAVQASRRAGHPRARAEVALGPTRSALSQHRALVRVVVLLAPLAGLLGTVGGMIETFDSLAAMALFTQGGGIAGGIAEALVSTQMGLAVAVPGVILGRLLDRAEDQLQDELSQVVELCWSAEIHREAA